MAPKDIDQDITMQDGQITTGIADKPNSIPAFINNYG